MFTLTYAVFSETRRHMPTAPYLTPYLFGLPPSVAGTQRTRMPRHKLGGATASSSRRRYDSAAGSLDWVLPATPRPGAIGVVCWGQHGWLAAGCPFETHERSVPKRRPILRGGSYLLPYRHPQAFGANVVTYTSALSAMGASTRVAPEWEGRRLQKVKVLGQERASPPPGN